MRDGGLPATETPVNTTLDDMLGNLQEEMDKQGIKTTLKGICFACDKPIVGQVSFHMFSLPEFIVLRL
jgi:hypothetical protein